MDKSSESIEIRRYLDPATEKHVVARTYDAGSSIYNEGECPKGVFIVEEGLVGLTYISANGSESLLRVFTTGNIFGHRSLLAEEAYHANAMALKDTKILFIDKMNADRVFKNQPDVMMIIIRIMARDLKNAEIRLRNMASKKVTGRIIEALIFLKNKNPQYSWTRREIGEFCGAKTETVSRVLGQLEKKNLIEKVGRDINIRDEEALLYMSQTDD
jgi:CRP-like cAMP-binding protein